MLTEPALAPDGAHIAYVRLLTPIVLPNQSIDTGADLYLANRDGTGAMPLLPHWQQNEQIRAPAGFPDGNRLADQRSADPGRATSLAWRWATRLGAIDRSLLLV